METAKDTDVSSLVVLSERNLQYQEWNTNDEESHEVCVEVGER